MIPGRGRSLRLFAGAWAGRPPWRWDQLVFWLSAGFPKEEPKGSLRTNCIESFCYWAATKCGFKILGRVTELLLLPAGVKASQAG